MLATAITVPLWLVGALAWPACIGLIAGNMIGYGLREYITTPPNYY